MLFFGLDRLGQKTGFDPLDSSPQCVLSLDSVYVLSELCGDILADARAYAAVDEVLCKDFDVGFVLWTARRPVHVQHEGIRRTSARSKPCTEAGLGMSVLSKSALLCLRLISFRVCTAMFLWRIITTSSQ